ncbi:MAG: phosphoribosylformylglycinamidine synthase, partial [Firmicutes bacterium]|nr:phosphoribosylformylglycinamidine synthase [Bacillota bacterium]
VPADGDRVILLGGKTGRDGCGGATGSSKSHDLSSLESCGAEVQKGNAPEERKLQRLFRNPEASKLIKRCNDFGAGGVSVAIGELAAGLEINLDVVPKKYDGLDGTELAISESQERMAVVVEEKDVERFCELAKSENLEATVVARVTEEPRLSMHWNGQNIVNLSREFLDSNGAEKHITVEAVKPEAFAKEVEGSFADNYKALAGDLNVCSKRGLSERFDSTIGAGTVLMPFGGKYQRTPIQAMVNKVSVEKADTTTCSLMAWGYNPFIMEKSPYHGAYLAVVESVSKLVAQGADFSDVYLSFQEYFEKLAQDPKKWGKPFSALLGALEAQLDLGVGAIGGKDSMSGTFENMHVPPTLVSFAVTTEHIDNIVSPEFKEAGHPVYLIKPQLNKDGLPTGESLKALYAQVTELMRKGIVKAAYTPTLGGVAEAVLKMAMGNGIGFEYAEGVAAEEIFGYNYGAFVIEATEEIAAGTLIGKTIEALEIKGMGEVVCLKELCGIYEDKLEPVFSCNLPTEDEAPANLTFESEKKFGAKVKCDKPKVLIPAFPGTNCEYDTAKAFARAGAEPEIFVVNNLTAADVAKSIADFAAKVRESQIIFIPGGFSGGDEPDGSGKFITAFFRNQEVKEAVTELLEERDGLMAGICNGFQALIKLGLVPYGKIIDTDENCPTLTFNKIARHQSKLVRTRIASNNSPWLANTEVDDVYTVPISHGEGRFIAPPEVLQQLAANGQIITQYVDMDGNATQDIQFNPNGSDWAIEGIVSPDGRVLGKMGHSERIGSGLYQNVPGEFDMKMF